MASSGRGGGGWRGRGGRRGGRDGGGYREYRPRRDPPPTNTEDLETYEIETDIKKIIISVKSNDQGRFFKLIEQKKDQKGGGQVIFSVETAPSFKRHLTEVIEKYKTLPPSSTDDDSSQRHYSESFSQGRRRFYIDLRQNSRGYFLKVTQSTPAMKKFVLIPAEILDKFEEHFLNLLDKFGMSRDDSSPPRSPQNSQPPLPGTHEVRAGSKTFYFDPGRNERGVYVRVTELLLRPTRRTHINIPNSCWSQMSDIFKTLHNEMPYVDSGSGSGSEDN